MLGDAPSILISGLIRLGRCYIHTVSFEKAPGHVRAAIAMYDASCGGAKSCMFLASAKHDDSFVGIKS
jgi:hypothetical protein